VIYANSITLTPGTVSVELENGSILVHALTKAGADGLSSGDMDRRSTVFEAAS
jgi:multicomponent Na+:H+ antiporter subunit E